MPRTLFDWKLASDAELLEHIVSDANRTVYKQLHYYKRMGNQRMYDRLIGAAQEAGFYTPQAEGARYVKKTESKLSPLDWKKPSAIPSKPLSHTFHWTTASVDEMVERMRNTHRSNYVDKIRVFKIKVEWDTVRKMYEAMKRLDRDSHK